MNEQLTLDAEAPRAYTCCGAPVGRHAADCANPNLHLFDADGSPRRLLWCSDTARLGGPCPYTGDRARFAPAGGCCKDLSR